MKQFEKLTLSQKIAEHIASQIVEGKLYPGERILEQKFTDQFGTSRAPVREALFILENQGIVERIPRRGVFVKEYTRKDILDFYDVVYRVTEFALDRGLNHHDDKQLKRLFSLITRMEETINNRDIKKCFILVEELHLGLIKYADNSVLEDIYEKLNKRWTTFRYLTLSHPDSIRRSIQEYKNIIIGLDELDREKVFSVLKTKENRALKILDTIVV